MSAFVLLFFRSEQGKLCDASYNIQNR
jgi:hypothetical protein